MPSLRFSGCQHRALSSGVPRLAPISESSDTKAAVVTNPVNCLRCTLKYTKEKHMEILRNYDQKVISHISEYQESARKVYDMGDKLYIQQHSEDMFRWETVGEMGKLEDLWKGVAEKWDGAKRTRKVKQDVASENYDLQAKTKVTKKVENLSIELDIPWRGTGGFICVDLVWREGIERDEGEVMETERFKVEVRRFLDLPEPR